MERKEEKGEGSEGRSAGREEKKYDKKPSYQFLHLACVESGVKLLAATSRWFKIRGKYPTIPPPSRRHTVLTLITTVGANTAEDPVQPSEKFGP
ncbi:hypothetical protein Pmani_009165 [Petrolisthes manimaculis]|uniref:Uncharacterized protein n=1 Tax=Petrolisthes manimaculis TaxID=1843537 RepID=A0AAE1Q4V2_9EUCA|nr:hypothetical protein Pmani_009165 [Petrolisthes manimaculis]